MRGERGPLRPWGTLGSDLPRPVRHRKSRLARRRMQGSPRGVRDRPIAYAEPVRTLRRRGRADPCRHPNPGARNVDRQALVDRSLGSQALRRQRNRPRHDRRTTKGIVRHRDRPRVPLGDYECGGGRGRSLACGRRRGESASANHARGPGLARSATHNHNAGPSARNPPIRPSDPDDHRTGHAGEGETGNLPLGITRSPMNHLWPLIGPLARDEPSP